MNPRPVLLLLIGLGLPGCATRLVPPAAPDAAVPIFIFDHGRHASLVLPGPAGGVVRYSYGDWRYYARAVTGFRSASAAALWPTRSALGRRELDVPPREADVRGAVRVWADTVLVIEVARARVDRLRNRLDSLHEAGGTVERLVNPVYDLDFVPHPRGYWLFHNSNQVVAGWLRDLGVETRGPTLLSSWTLEPLQDNAAGDRQR